MKDFFFWFLRQLLMLGVVARWIVLRGDNCGSPQGRPRLFLLAWRTSADLTILRSAVPTLSARQSSKLVAAEWNVGALPEITKYLLPGYEDDTQARLQALGNTVIPAMARTALSMLVPRSA